MKPGAPDRPVAVVLFAPSRPLRGISPLCDIFLAASDVYYFGPGAQRREFGVSFRGRSSISIRLLMAGVSNQMTP